jgi:hypothetical protein
MRGLGRERAAAPGQGQDTPPAPLMSWTGEEGGIVFAPRDEDEYWLSQTERLLAPSSERGQFCSASAEFGVCGLRLVNGACPRRH